MDPIITIPAVPAPGSPAAVWVFFVLGCLLTAAPLIIQIVRLTSWGRRNQAALGEIVTAIDGVKKVLPVEALAVTSAIRLREAPHNQPAVQTWKRVVAKVEAGKWESL